MEAKKEQKKEAKPLISKLGPKTFYDNHVDANFVMKAEELNMNDSYFIQNAKNTTFDFQGKFLNVTLEKCFNVTVTCKVWFAVRKKLDTDINYGDN